MGNFIESTKEATKGGFRGIKTVRGLLIGIEKVAAPPSWETETEQMKVSLEDAVVLEMLPGEEDFELKDGKFSFYIPYKTSENSSWMKSFVYSAEKQGKKPSEFIGQVVTLSKLHEVLFKQRDKTKPVDADGKYPLVEITSKVFSFIPEEGANSENTKEYIKKLITGLNSKAALRKLLTDTRAKGFPEFKEKLNDGTLADYLGLALKEDIFVEA